MQAVRPHYRGGQRLRQGQAEIGLPAVRQDVLALQITPHHQGNRVPDRMARALTFHHEDRLVDLRAHRSSGVRNVGIGQHRLRAAGGAQIDIRQPAIFVAQRQRAARGEERIKQRQTYDPARIVAQAVVNELLAEVSRAAARGVGGWEQERACHKELHQSLVNGDRRRDRLTQLARAEMRGVIGLEGWVDVALCGGGGREEEAGGGSSGGGGP